MSWFCQECETDNSDDVFFCEVCGAERNEKLHTGTKNNVTNEFELWNKACKKNTIKAYNGYISAYPDGKYILDAKNRITDLRDDKCWRDAGKENPVEGYKKYLSLYPNGRHKEEALRAIDEDTKRKKKIKKTIVSSVIIGVAIVSVIILLFFGFGYVRDKGISPPIPLETPVIQETTKIQDIETKTEMLIKSMEVAKSMNSGIDASMKAQAEKNLLELKQAGSSRYGELKSRYDRL